MNLPEVKNQDDFIDRNPPLALKVWFYEAEISEMIYKFWCKITGGKFEKTDKERLNSCVLVTKKRLSFNFKVAFKESHDYTK